MDTESSVGHPRSRLVPFPAQPARDADLFVLLPTPCTRSSAATTTWPPSATFYSATTFSWSP